MGIECCNVIMNVMRSVMIIIRCICGVLADKLVILVTHQLQYAQHANSILVLKEVCCNVTELFVVLRLLLLFEGMCTRIWEL